MGFVRLLLRGDVVLINQTPPASQRLYLHLARDAEGGRPVTRQKQNDLQIVSLCDSTATLTAARAETGKKIRAAAMNERSHMLAYPTASMLNVPVVQSTSPVAMKAMLISSGVTRVKNFWC